jgi:hypothetical protein
VAGRKRDDLVVLTGQYRVGGEGKGVDTLLNELREGLVVAAFGSQFFSRLRRRH